MSNNCTKTTTHARARTARTRRRRRRSGRRRAPRHPSLKKAAASASCEGSAQRRVPAAEKAGPQDRDRTHLRPEHGDRGVSSMLNQPGNMRSPCVGRKKGRSHRETPEGVSQAEWRERSDSGLLMRNERMSSSGRKEHKKLTHRGSDVLHWCFTSVRGANEGDASGSDKIKREL